MVIFHSYVSLPEGRGNPSTYLLVEVGELVKKITFSQIIDPQNKSDILESTVAIGHITIGNRAPYPNFWWFVTMVMPICNLPQT